jgi:HD superfamily phosphohydrolase
MSAPDRRCYSGDSVVWPQQQRIRDPLHDLIEFRVDEQLEGTLWRLIQTRPFQRLRRIKQLGVLYRMAL